MTLSGMLTIGHSTHSFSRLLDLLRQHRVTAVADVRSIPASRFAPQFNREALKHSLHDAKIKYVFLGEELGARTNDVTCYVDGRVQYSRLARKSEFSDGIQRLLKGARTERIAIMCTEQEPLDCHRTVLVARTLEKCDVNIKHIHGDGQIESQSAAMQRLMAKFGLGEADLFRSAAQRLEEALSLQEDRIAYVDERLKLSETTSR